MAFKMRSGNKPNFKQMGSSPMKQGGLLGKIGAKAAQLGSYLKDKSVNLGLTGQDYEDRKDFNRREALKYDAYKAESKNRQERNAIRHEGLKKSYEVYGNYANKKKDREAYADKYVSDHYANKKIDKGSMQGLAGMGESAMKKTDGSGKKMKGFSPFTHGADKNDKHGEDHRKMLENMKFRKIQREKDKSKRKDQFKSQLPPSIGRKI